LKSSATVILMWRSSGPIFDFPIAINHFHSSLWNKINVEMVSKTKNGFYNVLEKWKLTEESIENLLYYDENSHLFWEWVFWEFVRAYQVIHGNFSCQDSIHGIRSHRHSLRSLDHSFYRDRIFWVCFLTHYKNSKWSHRHFDQLLSSDLDLLHHCIAFHSPSNCKNLNVKLDIVRHRLS